MRGSIGTGAAPPFGQAGMLVASSEVTRERGGAGVLKINYEWGSTSGEPPGGATLPPEECGISMERIDIPLERHPTYATLAEVEVNAVRQLLQNFHEYAEKVGPEDVRQYQDIVADSADAQDLWHKMKRGFTHYPLWVPVYRWRLYYWTPPACTAGGYVEIPGGPVTPPADVDFLRQADSLDYNGSHWVLERSWISGPDIDTDIYPVA